MASPPVLNVGFAVRSQTVGARLGTLGCAGLEFVLGGGLGTGLDDSREPGVFESARGATFGREPS